MPTTLRIAAKGASNVISQMYGPGGALDSDTGETQFVDGLQPAPTTPPRLPLRSKGNTVDILPTTPCLNVRSPSLHPNSEAADILEAINDMLVENNNSHVKLEKLKAWVIGCFNRQAKMSSPKRLARPTTSRHRQDANLSPRVGSLSSKRGNGTPARLGARAIKAYAAHKAELERQEAKLLRVKQERSATPELHPKAVAAFAAHRAELDIQEERWGILKQEPVSESDDPPIEEEQGILCPAVEEGNDGDSGELYDGISESEEVVESYHKIAESYYEELPESYKQRLIDKIWYGYPGVKPSYCSK
ncbi:hypothetical protein M422DRAFT_43121 [Sphaerobolus stellatus SS14]|nr:hypothetical protein M422DRAFT_43121 [Sphaerobolus stellatus SS14]